jgi:hypothetical protein
MVIISRKGERELVDGKIKKERKKEKNTQASKER